MKKIALILPYYGKLPPFIYMWLKTCNNNPTIDWYLISDNENTEIINKLPDNVKYINLEFKVLKNKVDEVIGFDFEDFNPYRLCDCKPFYGEIFKEHISGYDFWGWCDPDMIFGDLRSYLDDELLSKYDRIFPKGHLSIIKNSRKVNEFVNQMKTDHRVVNVFKSKRPMGFDEGLFNDLCESLFFYKKMHHIDINPKSYILKDLLTDERCLIKYENGNVYDLIRDDKVSYVHYQKRKWKINNINDESFLLNEDGFVSLKSEIIEENIKTAITDFKYKINFIVKYLIPQSKYIFKERIEKKYNE